VCCIGPIQIFSLLRPCVYGSLIFCNLTNKNHHVHYFTIIFKISNVHVCGTCHLLMAREDIEIRVITETKLVGDWTTSSYSSSSYTYIYILGHRYMLNLKCDGKQWGVKYAYYIYRGWLVEMARCLGFSFSNGTHAFRMHVTHLDFQHCYTKVMF
jgi:hypothetical protein